MVEPPNSDLQATNGHLRAALLDAKFEIIELRVTLRFGAMLAAATATVAALMWLGVLPRRSAACPRPLATLSERPTSNAEPARAPWRAARCASHTAMLHPWHGPVAQPDRAVVS
jgi:hypothetical protein